MASDILPIWQKAASPTCHPLAATKGLSPSDTWFDAPCESVRQTACRSVQPFVAGLTNVTNRQIHRQTTQ